MSIKISVPLSPSVTQDKSSQTGLDTINQNIATILAFYTREEQKISRSQRSLENISGFVGRPLYLGSILTFVSLWVLANSFKNVTLRGFIASFKM
jgi:uncharacterized membrane protein